MALDLSAFYDIVPSGRLIDWTLVGIPGGIPARTTIFASVTGAPYYATGDNIKDNRAAFQAAFDACPSGQVVDIPTGYFRVNGVLNIPSGITVRGNGTGSVVIPIGTTSASQGLFQFGVDGVQFNPTGISTGITAGAVQFSTGITVQGTAGITTGGFLVISELNAPYVFISGTNNASDATWVDDWTTRGLRARGQIVKVLGITGNVGGLVTFTPPLYTGYTNTPWATRFQSECSWAGLENLQIYAVNSGTQRNVFFHAAEFCWVSGIESNFTDGDHLTLDWSFRCEIRKNYFHDAFVHSAGTLDTQVGLRDKSSSCLIVDNIFKRMHFSIIVEWGAAGNVIAYNFSEGNFDDAITAGNHWLPTDFCADHGAHPQYNLFEGNVGRKFDSDNYWGNSSYCTVFRNSFSGFDTATPPFTGRGATGAAISLTQARYGIDIWEAQYYFNVIGNAVGSTAWIGQSPVRKIVNPTARGYSSPPYAYSYGYTSEADGGNTLAMTNPTGTLIEHANWDFLSGVVYDPNISDHALPNSLFLAGKPDWFYGMTWPPIDPTMPTGFSGLGGLVIPAGFRASFGFDPPAAGGTILILKRLGAYPKLWGYTSF